MKSAVKDEAVVYFVELFNSWGRVILVFGTYGVNYGHAGLSVVCCGGRRAVGFSRQFVRKEF